MNVMYCVMFAVTCLICSFQPETLTTASNAAIHYLFGTNSPKLQQMLSYTLFVRDKFTKTKLQQANSVTHAICLGQILKLAWTQIVCCLLKTALLSSSPQIYCNIPLVVLYDMLEGMRIGAILCP